MSSTLLVCLVQATTADVAAATCLASGRLRVLVVNSTPPNGEIDRTQSTGVANTDSAGVVGEWSHTADAAYGVSLPSAELAATAPVQRPLLT